MIEFVDLICNFCNKERNLGGGQQIDAKSTQRHYRKESVNIFLGKHLVLVTRLLRSIKNKDTTTSKLATEISAFKHSVFSFAWRHALMSVMKEVLLS